MSRLKTPTVSTFLSLGVVAMLTLSACSKAPTDTPKATPAKAAEPAPAKVPDIVAVDSKGAKEVGKTGYAEVVHVQLAAGQSIPPHDGGARVIYSMSGYSLSFKKDGETKEATFKAGDVHFHPAGLHDLQNTGKTQADFVIFERLKGPLPSGEPAAKSDDTPKPGAGASEQSLFSGPAYDVFKVTIEPGGKLAPHKGFARAVYSLDDYEVKFHTGDQVKDRTFKTGEVHFHEPGKHWLENVGKAKADFLVVDYKK